MRLSPLPPSPGVPRAPEGADSLLTPGLAWPASCVTLSKPPSLLVATWLTAMKRGSHWSRAAPAGPILIPLHLLKTGSWEPRQAALPLAVIRGTTLPLRKPG